MATIPSAIQYLPLSGGTVTGTLTLTTPLGVTSGGTGLSSVGSQLPWVPADNVLLAANGPLDGSGQPTATLVAGTVYIAKVFIRAAFTWTNVNYVVATVGAGASSGSFVGLYNSSGTLLSSCADIGANLTATGAYSTPLTSAQALSAGTFVWVALVVNLATTQPQMRAEATQSFVTANLGLTAATFRAATVATGQTTLPASFTPS